MKQILNREHERHNRSKPQLKGYLFRKRPHVIMQSEMSVLNTASGTEGGDILCGKYQ